MKFFVELTPSPNKVGNAAHFINVERRLQLQVAYLTKLKDEGKIELGPFAILNRPEAAVAYVAETESWEELSHILHEDPMAVYQAPNVSYLSDYLAAMAKHADTRGSDSNRTDLEQDVRVDVGADLIR